MQIVDSHCHAGTSWFEPIESLLYQMESNGVDKAVLVQHKGVYDNSYLLEAAHRHPGRFAVVAMVGTSSGYASDRLEYWAGQGAVGVRFGPLERSPGDDPLAIWRKAAELGLTVSSQSDSVEDFASDDFARLVADLPGLKIVIEHLAGMEPGAQPPYDAYRKVLELARHPNTYVKVGGLGEFSERPPVLSPKFAFGYTSPLVEMALEAFGPRRTMWGSDFPPVSGREGYRNALHGVMDHPALKTPEDREWVMGKAALDAFSFV